MLCVSVTVFEDTNTVIEFADFNQISDAILFVKFESHSPFKDRTACLFLSIMCYHVMFPITFFAMV